MKHYQEKIWKRKLLTEKGIFHVSIVYYQGPDKIPSRETQGSQETDITPGEVFITHSIWGSLPQSLLIEPPFLIAHQTIDVRELGACF